MKPSRHVLAGVALAAILAAPPSVARAQTPPGAPAPVYALQGGVETARSAKTGLVIWMSGGLGQPVARSLGPAATPTPERAAAAFMDGQAAAFGLRQGSGELSTLKIADDKNGRSFVRFQQRYRELPIVGAELNVQLDDVRNVVSVNGKSVGDLDLAVQPEVSSDDAAKTAIVATARVHEASLVELTATTPILSIHDARILGGPPAPPALVWRVEVKGSARPDVRRLVLVNALNGRVAAQFNQVPNAAPPANAQQRVCDAFNTRSKYPCLESAKVVDPGSSAEVDVRSAFDYAEATYDFYARRFGRNSLDDNGLVLTSTVRYRSNSSQDYANAFWSLDNLQMVYGKNFAAGKDVVGHELTHGFTDFASGLFYYYQSGAVNESISDTMGELVQRSVDGTTAWLLGEELPIGAIRDMKNPPAFDQPDTMTSDLWEADLNFYDQGGVHANSGVGNKAVYLITDGGTFNGRTVKGLGLDKAAALYYRANAFILQSASDYADLGNALNQACRDLVGTKPKNKLGAQTKPFAAKDCDEVAKAVLATEMSKQPKYNPIPAEAAVCSRGDKPVTKSVEAFEAANTASFKYQPDDFHWVIDEFYSSSNKNSQYVSGSGQFDTSLTLAKSLTVPKKAFLRFAHFYNLTTYGSTSYAGGVVEYSVNNGAWLRVTPKMFLDNPYNTTLAAGANVLAGQMAFSGFSGGWTSSRINLASLAGKKVRFRFRLGTDVKGSYDGWSIDDIRLYTCKDVGRRIASAE